MTFYAQEIDINPAFGWQGGPGVDVLIRTLRNRHERRRKKGDLIRHRFTLPFQNIRDDRMLKYIRSAFNALGGPTDSFLVKDYGDFTHAESLAADPMPFATGDGVTVAFQLAKTYYFGEGVGAASYTRPITKPLSTILIYVNGTHVGATINTLTGIITFAVAPANGAVISWVGEFRVPVRFENFDLPATIDNKFGGAGDRKFATNANATLVEVFGE